MRLLIIDGKQMMTKEAMYAHLTRVFSLPHYFGNNLDALWDVLNETNEPTTIEFINNDLAKEYLGEYGFTMIRLLKKLETENESYQIYFM